MRRYNVKFTVQALLAKAMALSVDKQMTAKERVSDFFIINGQVKVLFTKYVGEGMAANEAAVKAMNEVRAQDAATSSN